MDELFLSPGGDPSQYITSLTKTVTKLSYELSAVLPPFSGRSYDSMSRSIAEASCIDGSGVGFDRALEDAIQMVVKDSVLVANPYFCAHLHCPPLLGSIAADLVISSLNQSVDTWDCSPSATIVEEQVVQQFCNDFGLGDKASGTFTSGGTQSNMIAMLLARDHYFDKNENHSVKVDGLPFASKDCRILCSKLSHFSLMKSASILGLGQQTIHTVDTLDDGSMCVDSLRREIISLTSAGKKIIMVVATAGTTDEGAIDPLFSISNVCKKNSIWLHVDAAYGGALIMTQYAERLKGIECADSVTVDFHKLFFQTICCSALLIKDKSHFSYIQLYSDYLNREVDAEPNLMNQSLATSRRFDAFKIWFSMRVIGRDKFSELIESLLTMAQWLSVQMKKNAAFEVLMPPSLTTVLFRCIATDSSNIDMFNRQIRLELLRSGKAVIGETKIKGEIYLKITLVNPLFNQEDGQRLIAILMSTASTLRTACESESELTLSTA